MKFILNLFRKIIINIAAVCTKLGKKICTFKFLVKTILSVILVALLSPIFLYIFTENHYSKYVYSNIENIPAKRVAIVFGAGVGANNSPSTVLRDRILTAVELYKSRKVEKIIMSGDNSIKEYDEPSVMIAFAIENGIPENSLQPDYAGRRTYDTCFRAKHIFGLNDAILITQNFHLTRALYLCNSIGIDSIGLASDLNEYQGINYMQIRDIYALSLAFIDVEFRKPEVILGEKIEI